MQQYNIIYADPPWKYRVYTVVGEYMCQGRMPDAVRARYVKMKEQPDHMPNLDALIENFDRALSHPDAADLDNLRKMVTV